MSLGNEDQYSADSIIKAARSSLNRDDRTRFFRKMRDSQLGHNDSEAPSGAQAE